MEKWLLLLVFTTLLSGCYQNTRNCEDFKTGTFKWEQDAGGKLLTTVFTRTEEYQIETFENKKDTSRVEWVNDCEWRIIPINPETNAESRAYLFKILQTTENGYRFEFSQSGRDQVYKGEAIKIED
jgi:hypothetical protein